MKKVLALLLVCFSLLPLLVDAQISRQPYLQKVDQHSLVIAWRSSSAQSFELRYGDTSGNLPNSTLTAPDTKHAVDITGLDPYKQYYYRIYDTGGTPLIDEKEFYTAMPDTMCNFDMLVFGDCGVNNGNQTAVRDRFATYDFDFALVCGDVSQGDGTSYDDIYFSIYEDITDEKCFYTTIGNHDLYGYPGHNGTAQQYLEDFYLFTNNPQNTEEYYSFEYGNAKIIALHVNFPNDYAPGSPQYDWLISELECRTTDWVFIYFHQPPYTNSWDALWYLPFQPFYHYDGEDEVRADLVPVFEQYNVDFVFNGHMHGYERGLLNGIYYVTSGGGGGNLDSSKPNNWTHISVQNHAHHFLIVEVDSTNLTVTAIDKNNNIIDNFTHTKAPTALVAEWEPAAEPVCNNEDVLDLTSLLHEKSTLGGWSGTGVIGSTFDPLGLDGTYDVTYSSGVAPCEKSITKSITVQACPIELQLTAVLEGAYDPVIGEMRTDLRTEKILSTSQPFLTAPWGYAGGENVADINSVSPDVVDWVLAELRDPIDNSLVDAAAGFLLKDGNIVNVDNTGGLQFWLANPNKSYNIILRSRNHIDLMSANPVAMTYPQAVVYDFTAAGQTAGVDQTVEVASGIMALHSGDINGDGAITTDDYNVYKIKMSAMNTYLKEDATLDGDVTVDDYLKILLYSGNIGVIEVRY